MTDIEKVREELGDWPIIVARSHEQFRLVCELLRLNPMRTRHANARALEGARPTSVVFGPDWTASSESPQIGQVLDRLLVKQRPVMTYLSEDDLR